MQINTNIIQRFQEARKKSQEERAEKEKAKLGVLRAGSSGIMAPNGDVIGTCPRIAHLRSLGIEGEITLDKHIMFELGFANEDIIYEHLQATRAPGEVILREEEIPIEWTVTSTGQKVMGRPDVVICQESLSEKRGLEILPVLGLELKSTHSMWVLLDVFFGGEPKTDHLIQACHYMWKLNIPYKLIYKSYSQLGQGMGGSKSEDKDWILAKFPRPGEPGSEHIEWNDKGGIKHIKQVEIAYDLSLREGRVHFRKEGTSKWTPTIVNTADVERYFEFLSNMGEGKPLGKKPITASPTGEKKTFSPCNYCDLKKLCNSKKELSYSEFIAGAREVFSSQKKSDK